MKFQDTEINQPFKVVDPSAPLHMQGVVFKRVISYLDTDRQLYVNAERVQKIDDAYDGQWINGSYEVELT